ncbi:hypothetical protein ACOMHN_052295 [Nucella lapillus]
MKMLSPWTLPPDLIPQQIISLGHHMAHNPGMDQQHMVDLAHPLDVVLVALERDTCQIATSDVRVLPTDSALWPGVDVWSVLPVRTGLESADHGINTVFLK